ncbi:MAG: restriction endonuclease subunit S [SAR324 cluster bacterium]|nr:restriction endonuclease subunit S [SAR324 cluster bacterium]
MGELFGYEFIGAQDMKRLQMSDVELVVNGLEEGDLLFGRRSLVESGAGKCSVVENLTEPVTFESSIIRVRLDKTKCNPLFYYYYFRSHVGRGKIRAIVSGTNVKGIRGSDLKKVEVSNPSLEIQNRLVSKIRKYDDLIENNRRRIQLLEESARLLYREWFVQLRFPGYEHTKITNGIPDGWEQLTIDDVSVTIGGGTPSTKVPEYWENGDITWFVPKDLTGNNSLILLDSEKKITEAGLKKSSAKMLPAETILMSSRASIGFFGLHEYPCCTNQGFISVIPKSEQCSMFLLFNLMSRVDEIKALAGGTTFKEINKSTFRAIPVIIPEAELLKEFHESVHTVIKQVRVIKKQNQKLTEARDLLLPRLMNGEIAV